MMRRLILAVALFSLCLAGISTTVRVVEVDADIKPYTKVGGVSGNLNFNFRGGTNNGGRSVCVEVKY
jgi:hypothetical protein